MIWQATGARFLDHGVDTKHFAARPPSGAVTSLGHARPIIGFFGGLEHYVVDFDLLERVAKDRPQYNVVLIGDATVSLDRLKAHPNIHILGFQPYEKIPTYGHDFDISIMPYLNNDWTRWINPIKLKEYLLLGHEIVAAASARRNTMRTTSTSLTAMRSSSAIWTPCSRERKPRVTARHCWPKPVGTTGPLS